MQENKFPLQECKVKLVNAKEEGNGVVADVDIKKGDGFVSVPESFMLSTKCSDNEHTNRELAKYVQTDPLLKSSPSTTLSILLLYELRKQEKSFFKPYLDILPRYMFIHYFLVYIMVIFDLILLYFEIKLAFYCFCQYIYTLSVLKHTYTRVHIFNFDTGHLAFLYIILLIWLLSALNLRRLCLK